MATTVQYLPPLSAREAEYLLFSNFIGSLVSTGVLLQGNASILLVEAFWEKEAEDAWDHGIDLYAQVEDYQTRLNQPAQPVA